MDSEYHNHFIKDRAKEIKEKLAGGKLCGVEIDLNDPDQCLVGAYYMAELGNLCHIQDKTILYQKLQDTIDLMKSLDRR
jgi:hypothetical protein